MLEVCRFREAFIVKTGETIQSCRGWFDLVEREYVDRQTMYERYGTEQLDEEQLRRDMYIPIPILYERDIISDFLKEVRMEFLYDKYHGFQTKEDMYDFLAYKDERGCWLHDVYFAYVTDRENTFMEQWILDNRIMNAAVVIPMPTEGLRGPDDSMRRVLITFEQKRAANMMDEEYYKLRQSVRRTRDNRIVPQVPYYKTLMPQ